MLISNKQISYKSRTGHKSKNKLTKHQIFNKKHQPSLEREATNVSFKGGFSLTGLKRLFAPHISKTHNLDENLALLKKFVGHAPDKLNRDTIAWGNDISGYLKRSADGKQIEIVEKNWPTLLAEGVIYPFKELPLHILNWFKKIINPNTKSSGILKKLHNTDIVNSMSGYMESAQKLKHDSETVQSASLFTKAMKMFDPMTGSYNGVHERALTRIVTGFIPAFFLANDAYNLSRLCDDDVKEAKKEKKLRFRQEVKRVMSNAYLQLITLGALSKYINKSTSVFVAVSAVTIFITEALSRLTNGKKIHFISAEEAKAMNAKENNNKNIEKQDKKPNKALYSKPGFKGSQVFNGFGMAADMPLTQNYTISKPKFTEAKNNKELKPLLSFSVLSKWFIGTAALGIGLRYGTKIPFGKNKVCLTDYMNVISQKYKSLYDRITQNDYTIENKQFKKIIDKLRNYDEVIANKVETVAYNHLKVATIKNNATSIANELENAGFSELAEAFKHLNNLKHNNSFTKIQTFNEAKLFFSKRDKQIISQNLNELFLNLETANLKQNANELKEIIFENGKVNIKRYKEALNYVKNNISEYVPTFENRFKVDNDGEILKMFAEACDKIRVNKPQKATEVENLINNSINSEYIKLGKQKKFLLKELVDFVTEPIKFFWGTITLPYKHVAKKVIEYNKKDLPKWEKEFESTTNFLKRVTSKSFFNPKNVAKIDLPDEEFAKYMNDNISKAFNNATMSSVSNSDLSALAKNTAIASTLWFLMADNYNMVMQKSNGEDKENASLKAKERLVQETSRTFYNLMFINLFNNTFRSLFNSSLFGAQLVNTASTYIGENANRFMIGVPIGEKTRDEILQADRDNLQDEGLKGHLFRFMSRLTGKKALTQRETSKK